MQVSDAIKNRRSIKQFTNRAPTREEIETLLAAVTFAPNHRLTQPWRFYVLGPEARYGYGLALGERKARKKENPQEAEELRDRVAAEHRALPAMILVAMVHEENAEVREENYAAVMKGIQNLALVAVELGLGTHIKTGAIMDDPAARSAAGVADNERVVACINVGEPAAVPDMKARTAAAEFTTWTD